MDNLLYRKKCQKKESTRTIIGDVQFTDDINDDWFGITFNSVYIGDYTPNAIYIHKHTGKIKILKTNFFCLLKQGLFIHFCMKKYKFDVIHQKILEKLARECFRQYNSESDIKLDNVLITMSLQRV